MDVGEGADNDAGSTVEIFGVVAGNPDSVATEEDEFDLVGLAALADGVGNEGLDVVEGDGRE